MRIVLTTFGSRGDVQPMLALALGLQRRGHTVLLVGPQEKAGWAQQRGCPYASLSVDVTTCVDSMGTSLYSLSAVTKFMSMVREGIKAQFRLLPEIVAGADLVIGSSLAFALSGVAEAMRIPYRYIAFSPQLLPSNRHPFPAVRGQTYPRWFNRLSWCMAGWTDKVNLKPLINRHRKHLGLKPINDAWLHILGSRVIVATDPVVAGLPLGSLPRAVQTGYMHLDQSDPESGGLAAFLNTGSMPVYAGFGSMPESGQVQALPIIIEAVRSAGCRAVISRFRDVPPESDQAEDIFFVRNYPHRHLFPHMAAIIHHGGAGTTATAAVSGSPQIIVPHVLDQYYWGHRIHRNRLGPKPIWRSRLKIRELAEAVKSAVSDSRMKQQAMSVAGAIQQTDGVGATIMELLQGFI